MASGSPIVQEAFNKRRILKHYIIHMPIHLTIQCDCRWLAFWTDSLRPRWMISATTFDTTNLQKYSQHFYKYAIEFELLLNWPHFLAQHTKSSSATNLPRSTPDVNFRTYEWNDTCLIFCSLRYSSFHGSSGEQWTQHPFELWRQSFGSRSRCKRPSAFASIWSTSSSFSSVLVAVADFAGFRDDANDAMELLELLVLGCPPNASAIYVKTKNKNQFKPK